MDDLLGQHRFWRITRNLRGGDIMPGAPLIATATSQAS